jgi:hypothetical protein
MKKSLVFFIIFSYVLAFSSVVFAQSIPFDGPLMNSYDADSEFETVFEKYLKALISDEKFVRVESPGGNDAFSAPIENEGIPLCQRVKRYVDRDGTRKVTFWDGWNLYYIDISVDGKNIMLTDSGK